MKVVNFITPHYVCMFLTVCSVLKNHENLRFKLRLILAIGRVAIRTLRTCSKLGPSLTTSQRKAEVGDILATQTLDRKSSNATSIAGSHVLRHNGDAPFQGKLLISVMLCWRLCGAKC